MDPAKILIVDDQIHALKGMSRIMTSAGYDTFEANNGEDCLKMAAEHKPDLILLDVVLPDIDGKEVCRRIKSNLKPKTFMWFSCPAFKTESDSQAEGLEYGADGYIARPIPNRELLARVKSILKLKNVENRLRESEARYRIVADYAYDWEYWVDAQGNFLYVSPSCERITGYSAEEFMADTDLMNRIIHPDDRNEMVDHYHNVKNIVPDVMEARDFRIIHRGGETRWIGHVCQPVYDKNGQPSGRRGSNRDITERKLMEEDLQRSEKFLEQVVENIPDMIFVKDAEKLSFVRFNKAGEELLGYSREDLIGKNDYDLFPPSQAGFFITNDREVLRNGKLVEIPEEEIDTSFKGKRTLHTKKIPILGADGLPQFLLGISEDITERQQSSEMNLRLAAIVDSSDDAIIGKTLDGTITSWNKGAESLYGYRSDEVIGQPVSILLPPELLDDFSDMLTRINRGELVSQFETKRRTKNGEIIEVSLTISPIRNPTGQIIGASSIARDITDRKRLEQEKQNLIDELQKALSEVKKLSGFLPICASCKKIRDDTGYWNEIERYIGEHSEVEFSHGICPDCMRKLYPEEADEILGPLEKDEKK